MEAKVKNNKSRNISPSNLNLNYMTETQDLIEESCIADAEDEDRTMLLGEAKEVYLKEKGDTKDFPEFDTWLAEQQ